MTLTGLADLDGDGQIDSDTATVRAATRPNVPPVANDDSAGTPEDTPVTVSVPADGTDADGDTLTVASVTQGTRGAVVNNASNVSDTPNTHFYGSGRSIPRIS